MPSCVEQLSKTLHCFDLLMNRSTFLLWSSLLLLILLLPTAAGRVLLDLAGGLVVVLLALPLLLTGLGWIGWKLLQSRMVPCPACGAVSFGRQDRCGVCGAELQDHGSNASADPMVPASEVTIDVSAQDVGSEP